MFAWLFILLFENACGQEIKIVNPGTGLGFGKSLAIDQGFLLIGADDAVYVFKFQDSQWILEDRLTISSKGKHRFGSSIGLSLPYAIVGAPGEKTAYIFKREKGKWKLEAVLSSPNNSNDYFGSTVALSQAFAIVGAKGDFGDYVKAGSVHIFKNTIGAWKYDTTLAEEQLRANAYFGSSVATCCNRLVIGAPHALSGAVHIFHLENNKWIKEITISGKKGSFGTSVAIDSNVIVVGAPQMTSEKGQRDIHVYEFESGKGWYEKERLPDPIKFSYVMYGSSLCLKNGIVVAGSGGEMDRFPVVLYKKEESNWRMKKIINLDEKSDPGFFGEEVVTDGEWFVVSAAGDNDLKGAVYLYRLSSMKE